MLGRSNLEPGAWQWAGERHRLSQRSFRRILAGLGALVVVPVIAFSVILVRAYSDGRSLTVTNGCGFDVYLDNNVDGITLRASETVTVSHATASGKLMIRVWRGDPGQSDPGLEVALVGDSTLSGPTCPS